MRNNNAFFRANSKKNIICSFGMGRKGVSPLLATVILVLITVVISTMVSGFITSVSSERSKRVQNLTQARLACQYASLYVTNVTYDCNNDCFTGSPYRINATLQNPGSASLGISTMSVSLDNGETYIISVNSTTHSSGSLQLKNFNSILVNSSPLMPIGTMDNRNAYVNDSNTVSLWHFDDGGGSTAIDSAGGSTGTVTGATWNSSGRFGYGLTFDGVNDYVNIPDSSALNISGDVIALEAWFYPKNCTTTAVMGKGNQNGYGIFLYSDNKFYFYAVDANIGLSTSCDLNQWQHIAGVYNGTHQFLYKNGVLVGSEEQTGTINNTEPFQIGNITQLSSYKYFNGSIDEVRISNVSKVFTTTLNFTISHPNIAYVRLFNQSNQLENASSNLNGASYYSGQLSVNTAADYRIVVEDTSGSTIEKWYPYRQGGYCKKTSTLDKITFSTNNCPDTSDTYYGSDVTFVNCV